MQTGMVERSISEGILEYQRRCEREAVDGAIKELQKDDILVRRVGHSDPLMAEPAAFRSSQPMARSMQGMCMPANASPAVHSLQDEVSHLGERLHECEIRCAWTAQDL